MPKWEEYKSEAKERGALAMEFFIVKSKPSGDMALVKSTLPAHLAYQKEMEAAGKLVMAGPVSDASGEMMEAEGLIVYRAADLDAARKIADADPMHAAGARAYEIRKWLVNEGSLTFTVSLSSQSVTLP
ncbi:MULTISPECIES: YciI family protein [Halocynthiibacter]|uniref:YciI family protein n=1 Tax=Halocynthiibacter halioticoli TaxID=2986804 RepID=A0AAE3J3K2_9RHOB|nr:MULTISPECIES: YciI family protein [Halocynthiibacter]MCV6824837.1 YciI family protein [Halocynthiibacter halioticoli]MCW4057838.1 YciI family protein [Halocynthiibacter sp. SDUM655004]